MRTVQLALLAVATVLLGSASHAEAQVPGSAANRYRGGPNFLRRPAVSPWLDLYRRDGVIDPYNEFVRPRFQMQNYLLQQDRQMHREQVQRRQMQEQQERQQAALEDLQRPQQTAAPQRQGFQSQTGIGAGFMQYGGFMTHGSYFGVR